MIITRDPKYPEQAARLLQVFNTCANGYRTDTVFEAAFQMLIMVIHMNCRRTGMSVEQACEFAEEVGRLLPQCVRDQWDRRPEPTDIEVSLHDG